MISRVTFQMSEEGEQVQTMEEILDKTFDLFHEAGVPCDWKEFEIVEDQVMYFKWIWARGAFEVVLQVRACIELADVFVNENEHQREALVEANLPKAIRRLRCFMDDLD